MVVRTCRLSLRLGRKIELAERAGVLGLTLKLFNEEENLNERQFHASI
jgi:hypothetical protein